jgi:Tol biopolymer transport system component
VRNIEQFEGRPISGSEGADTPRFSPDGKWLAFVADRKLKKVAVDGGDAVIVTDFTEGRGVTWESNEAILFNQGRASGIWRVPSSGGKPTAVTTIQLAEIEHDFPEVLPDGSALFFSARVGGEVGTYQIYAQSRQTGDRHAIASGAGATYLPTGHLVFLQASTLYAVPFDPVRLEATGMPVALVQGVAQSAFGAPLFSVSPSGTLAYVATGQTARRDALVWVDERGTEQATAAAGGEYAQPRLAPDARRVAVTLSPGGGLPGGNPGDVWVYDLTRETWSRLTFDGRSQFPVWMPDGRSLTFSSAKAGPFDIYVNPIDGTSPEARLVGGGDGTNYPLSWSPDGESLTCR